MMGCCVWLLAKVHRSSHTNLPTKSVSHKWLLRICLVHRSSHTNLPTQSVTHTKWLLWICLALLMLVIPSCSQRSPKLSHPPPSPTARPRTNSNRSSSTGHNKQQNQSLYGRWHWPLLSFFGVYGWSEELLLIPSFSTILLNNPVETDS